MNRPLDPDAPDSLALSLRITRPLADALDAELARFTAQNPGVSASRATIARIALMRAFLPSGNVLASASAPAPLVALPAPAPPPEAPAVATAPAAPAPEARPKRAPRVERASSAVPAVASAPVVDPRQLAIPGAVAILAPSSEPAAAPRRARGKAVATPENDALRARYTAALAAKRLTNKPTAARVGCSEGTLHQWQAGTIKNLGGDKDPDGKWLAALTVILDALPPPLG